MEYLPSVRYCRAPYTASWCFGETVIYVPPPRRYGESGKVAPGPLSP